MTTATVVRRIENKAVAEAHDRLTSQAKRAATAKERAREVLNSPDLKKRANALSKALMGLGIKIGRPPSEGPALEAWCSSAAYILEIHSNDTPSKSVGRPMKGDLGQKLLSEDAARALGWKPQKAKKSRK